VMRSCAERKIKTPGRCHSLRARHHQFDARPSAASPERGRC
jgi:hypothetical protein